MKYMHKPGDEKRSIVILRPQDYDEWLHTKCCKRKPGDSLTTYIGHTNKETSPNEYIEQQSGTRYRRLQRTV
ncbi:protein of unknown function [Burkholderia multivorans]